MRKKAVSVNEIAQNVRRENGGEKARQPERRPQNRVLTEQIGNADERGDADQRNAHQPVKGSMDRGLGARGKSPAELGGKQQCRYRVQAEPHAQ